MPLIQWLLNLLDGGGPAPRLVGCLHLAERDRSTVRLDEEQASTVAMSQSARASVSLALEVC